jgi:hypothetical protein
VCRCGGARAGRARSAVALAGDKVLQVSIGEAPRRRQTWSWGTKLTRKGSSAVRRLSGGGAAALQRWGSSGGRRRGPSGPAAGGGEGGM